jgi:hypothetical protein
LLIIGGTITSGCSRTCSVVGRYWMSSNAGRRRTTAPGVRARFSPTAKADVSTMDGIRGGRDMSPANLRAPRTKFMPPVSIAAFRTAGFSTGLLLGAAASSRFSATKRTRRSAFQSRSASQTSWSTVRPVAR